MLSTHRYPSLGSSALPSGSDREGRRLVLDRYGVGKLRLVAADDFPWRPECHQAPLIDIGSLVADTL
jgi:hypothetical protein